MARFLRVRRLLSPALVGLSLLVVPHLVTPTPLSAQEPSSTDAPLQDDWSDAVPAHISYAESETWLERDGQTEAAPLNVPLLAGDRLQTRQGRLEVQFADGSALWLDEHTRVDLLSETLLRLTQGTIRLELARGADQDFRIDAVGTTARLRSSGEYRIEADARAVSDPSVRLLVIRGAAELDANGQRTLVRTGYEAYASARTTPTLPRSVVVTRWDEFDRFHDDRTADRSGYASADHLPVELSRYGSVLDRDGDWAIEPTYGAVWYPRVAETWSPYSVGRWAYVGAYGWVWVGSDRWAWPTHHYGRWGHSGRRYFWIPGRHWAPAWVAWASAPGYVGWVPLGFDNRPLLSIHIGISTGWRGWTYAPSHAFRSRVVIASRERYIPPRGVPLSSGFRAPVRPADVPDRLAGGFRGPVARGTVAVPRDGRLIAPARTSASLPRRPSGPEQPSRAAVAPDERPTVVDRRSPARAGGATADAPRQLPPSRMRAPERAPADMRTAPAPRQRVAAPTSEGRAAGSRQPGSDREVGPRPASRPPTDSGPAASAPRRMPSARPAPPPAGPPPAAAPRGARGRTQPAPAPAPARQPAPARVESPAPADDGGRGGQTREPSGGRAVPRPRN
jgi:hypothetical protein